MQVVYTSRNGLQGRGGETTIGHVHTFPYFFLTRSSSVFELRAVLFINDVCR